MVLAEGRLPKVPRPFREVTKCSEPGGSTRTKREPNKEEKADPNSTRPREIHKTGYVPDGVGIGEPPSLGLPTFDVPGRVIRWIQSRRRE